MATFNTGQALSMCYRDPEKHLAHIAPLGTSHTPVKNLVSYKWCDAGLITSTSVPLLSYNRERKKENCQSYGYCEG